MVRLIKFTEDHRLALEPGWLKGNTTHTEKQRGTVKKNAYLLFYIYTPKRNYTLSLSD